MTDSIKISALRANCILGVDKAERLAPQPVEIHVTLEVDLEKAGKSDRVTDTIDYKHLANSVTSAVESSSYRLIEALADRIADVCLSESPALAIEVEVRKPNALARAEWAGVTIRRSRRLRS